MQFWMQTKGQLQKSLHDHNWVTTTSSVLVVSLLILIPVCFVYVMYLVLVSQMICAVFLCCQILSIYMMQYFQLFVLFLVTFSSTTDLRRLFGGLFKSQYLRYIEPSVFTQGSSVMKFFLDSLCHLFLFCSDVDWLLYFSFELQQPQCVQTDLLSLLYSDIDREFKGDVGISSFLFG